MKVIQGFVLLAFLVVLLPGLATAQGKKTYGWVEKVQLIPSQILLNAKLDTGADNSSLNASHVEEFKKGDQRWVRFNINNRYGKTTTIEQPIIRTTLIKRHIGNSIRRLVIRLPLCLGNTYMEVDVNLANREDFEYQMLIGRSFLAGHAIIDPAIMYSTEPRCKGAPKP